MTNIVTIPCKYLVFNSDYDERLIEPRFISRFVKFCSSHDVIPFGLYQGIYRGNKGLIVTPVRNGKIILDAIPTEDEQRISSELTKRITQSNLGYSGCFIFKVGSFETALKVIVSMKDLKYCKMHDLTDIKFLANNEGFIDLIFVSVDAESG